jgi:hypothetical protein
MGYSNWLIAKIKKIENFFSMHALRYYRVIRKVRKTRHQNAEFGQTKGEIKKKPAKKYISIQRGMKLRKPSILVVNGVSSSLSFFLSASTAATYILTAPNFTTTIETCALNAGYQHFILRFIKNVFTLQIPLIGCERRPKDRVKTALLYG